MTESFGRFGPMKELSRFKGDGEFADREARVLFSDYMKQYFVEMREDEYIETRNMGSHNERYAEDCAENFVMGLITTSELMV